MELVLAETIALDLINVLADYCEKIEIAGSIRRQKNDVKDIEIVAVPQLAPSEYSFGLVNQLNVRLGYLLGKGEITQPISNRKTPFGPRYYKFIWKDCHVDLFAVLPPADFGIIFALRTGPAEYSKWLVTEALRKGMKVMNGALYEVKSGTLLEPAFKNPTVYEESVRRILCPNEKDFFKALGIEYKEPSARLIRPSEQK